MMSGSPMTKSNWSRLMTTSVTFSWKDSPMLKNTLTWPCADWNDPSPFMTFRWWDAWCTVIPCRLTKPASTKDTLAPVS